MKKFMKFMLMAVLVAAFNSCSENDGEHDYTPEGPDVKEQYASIVSTFYDADKQPVFTPTPDEGIYIAQTASSQRAHNYIVEVIRDEWDGKTCDINLGEYGTIKLIGGADTEEGIYNEIIVNVKGYMPFTLKIVDQEWLKGDNAGGYTSTAIVI